MPHVSEAFIAVGVIYLLRGKIRSMVLGAPKIYTMAPAHAHFNLLGWVTMALDGDLLCPDQRCAVERGDCPDQFYRFNTGRGRAFILLALLGLCIRHSNTRACLEGIWPVDWPRSR